MKTNYLSKEETWAENYSIYKINCKIFCKGIQNQKLKNQPTNLPLPNLKQNFFFFCLRRFYWRPRFSTPEILLILLYFSLQHPLRTWRVTYPSSNHGSSCLTSVILQELVFPTWYCRSFVWYCRSKTNWMKKTNCLKKFTHFTFMKYAQKPCC